MRRAKIVCTLGPATDSYDQIKALVEAGMDIARFNLSHGTYAEHEERYQRVRKASDETGRSVGILADLQGPKIRLGRFREGPVLLERGDEFTITVEHHEGDRHTCSTTYPGLAGDVTPANASSSTTAASPSKSPASTAPASTPASSKAAWSPTTRD